jgi:hypothetical protein
MKIAAVAVVLVVALVVGSKFMSSDESPSAPPEKEEPKTIYDMAERDKQFGEAPKPAETTTVPEPEPEPAPEAAPPTQAAEATPQPPAPSPAPAPSGVVLPSSITRPTTLYFKPLGEIEEIEAQRIMPVTTAARSIGRLPVTHFKLMVDGCRQILQKWPDSWYAFRAKQMLEEMPERFWRNYKVTEQELDISKFLKPRQGTQPFTVEPKR